MEKSLVKEYVAQISNTVSLLFSYFLGSRKKEQSCVLPPSDNIRNPALPIKL